MGKIMVWVIDIKGNNRGAGRYCDYEISVVRAGSHGVKSWGWMGRDKLLIAASGPCRDGVHPFVWQKYLEMANELRDLMNGKEDG